jgi:hypothetical protein
MLIGYFEVVEFTSATTSPDKGTGDVGSLSLGDKPRLYDV